MSCAYGIMSLGGLVPSYCYIVFFLNLPNMPKRERISFREQTGKLDSIGTIIFIGYVTSLLPAVQWRGTAYSWYDGCIVSLFVVFGVSMPIFVQIQYRAGDDASMPLRVITQRTVALATIYASLIIRTISMKLAMRQSVLLAEAFVKRQGYYVPPMILADILGPVGSGLISTFWLETSSLCRT